MRPGSRQRSILLAWAITAVMATASIATDARCMEVLQRAMESKNPETRKQAVIALSLASSDGRLFDQLEQMLQDKDVEVRQAVVASLEEVRTKSATSALHTALEDEVPEVSFAAAKILWARRDPAGKAALLAVLAGESKTSSTFLSRKSFNDGFFFVMLSNCLCKVIYQVIGILYTHAQPDQGIGQPVFNPFFSWDRSMGHGSRMVDQRFNTSQAFCQGK